MGDKTHQLNKKHFDFKALFLFGLLFMELCTLVGAYLSNGKSFQNLFFSPGDGAQDIFMDFFNAVQAGRSPYTSNQLYPPFVFLITSFFRVLIPGGMCEQGAQFVRSSQSGLMIYFLWSITQIYLFAQLFRKLYDSTKPTKESGTLTRELLLLAVLFSEPFLFLYERGNLIVLSVNCLILFLLWYNSENRWLRSLAFVALAVSAAVKIYPAIFGLLLLRERKWKQALQLALLGIGFFFVPFLFMEGENRNPFVFFRTLSNAVQEYYNNTGLGYRHDLSNMFRILGSVFNCDLRTMGNVAILVSLILGVGIALFAQNLRKWELYAILTLLMILIPGSNYTYCLTFMAIPLVVFLNTMEGKNTVSIWIYTLLFLLVFMPIVVTSNTDLLSPLATPIWGGYLLTALSLMESIALVALFIFLCIKGIRGLMFLRNRET